MLKNNIVSSFLARINVARFSRLIESSPLLAMPYKIISQRLVDRRFPQHVFLETTSACNLKCNFCPRNTGIGKIGFMDLGLFKKVVDEGASFGPRSYCLHLFGEPLLAPQLLNMISYVKKANSNNAILLTTNGVLLDEALAYKIIEYGVDKLVVSIIAATSHTYRRLAGIDMLDTVEANIMRLVSLKRKQGANKPIIYVRILRDEETLGELPIFRKKWKGQAVLAEIRDAHNYGGNIKDNILRKKPGRRYPCYHLWLSPAVSYDGDVSICCNDWKRQAVVGNAGEASLSSIWQGDLIRKYRDHHLSGEYEKIDICAKCDVWTMYPDIFFAWQKRA
jgi:MoaA/NifB/PqqE/SkfB family radical SAM enzyme